MINTINPAFEFLRQHNDVSDETEKLVLKKLRGRISTSDLKDVFENGLTGQYGKVYKLDPQTLIGWVDAYDRSKNSTVNYLEMPLVDVNAKDELINWQKEANKCLMAFLRGVSEDYFHHLVYSRMVLDGKIQPNSLFKYCPFEMQREWTEGLKQAARKVLRDTFLDYKSKGYSSVYFIQ